MKSTRDIQKIWATQPIVRLHLFLWPWRQVKCLVVDKKRGQFDLGSFAAEVVRGYRWKRY